MTTLSEKVEALKAKMGDSVPSGEGGSGYFNSDTYFFAAIVAIPAVAFLGLYLALQPKKDGGKNYKKIFMWTLIISLILIPLMYFASINGYLPF